jgi:acetyltransferase-like isoleucine patch superfamily enzyme
MGWKRLRYGLKHVDPTFFMVGHSRVRPDLRAGKHAYLGPECRIGPNVVLENYALLAPRIAVVGGDHDVDTPGVPMCFSARTTPPQTTIGEDAWIGYGVVIMAGVTIGRGAVVGAGAVVTKSIPPFEIWAGVPAKKIGERFPDPADRAKHEAMLDSGNYVGKYGSSLDMLNVG